MGKKSNNLTSVLDALKDGFYIISQDYTVEFMNETLANIFGNCTGKNVTK